MNEYGGEISYTCQATEPPHQCPVNIRLDGAKWRCEEFGDEKTLFCGVN
jgi:hypothetical protein